MEISQLADLSLDTIPELIGDLRAMSRSEEFSPKQRIDAIKVLNSVLQLVLDRTHPKLTASQTTNINVDAARALARILPPRQLKQLADKLSMRLPEPSKVVDVEPE
jgi:hypothetical protein